MPEQDNDPKKTDATDKDVRDLEPDQDVKGGVTRGAPGGGGATGGPILNPE